MADVSIREVAPRDGLQNEEPVPTEAKVRLIEALGTTGVGRIEAVSFVHPKAIPQMADADAVGAQVTKNPDIRYSALSPNTRGAQRAIAAGFREIEVVVSASDTHNQRNLNRSTEQSLEDIAQLIPLIHDAGATLEVIVATSFGCPFEGDNDPARGAGCVARGRADGADRSAFGDTTGMATPRRVRDLLSAVRPDLLHFHNTRGTGLANILTALDLGITEFDASVGGIGGCPYAPGASGNVATEEVVHMLHDMGIDTGIDLDRKVFVGLDNYTKLLSDAPCRRAFCGPDLVPDWCNSPGVFFPFVRVTPTRPLRYPYRAADVLCVLPTRRIGYPVGIDDEGRDMTEPGVERLRTAFPLPPAALPVGASTLIPPHIQEAERRTECRVRWGPWGSRPRRRGTDPRT